MKRHLTNDELMNRLYGIGGQEEIRHLRECRECAQRYEVFERRRVESAQAGEPEAGFYAAQRRAVYASLSEAGRGQARWTPAVAAAGLLAVGLLLYRPAMHVSETPVAAPAEVSDAQLFSDVYSIEESAEPLAAAPIQGLFETSPPADGGQN